jgi:hypothetical protein
MPQEFGHRHGYSFEERKENGSFSRQTFLHRSYDIRHSDVLMTYVILIYFPAKSPNYKEKNTRAAKLLEVVGYERKNTTH